MAKDGKKKKVHSRANPKYTTSSDEGSSSENEDDLLTLFVNLSMEQKEKLNELIEAIHEKDELLDSQEDFLIKVNKKHVKLKNAYAQEKEKCENLTKELSICYDSISSLKNENASLNSKVKDLNVCNDTISCLRDENAKLKSKIEELNVCKPSTYTVDHVSICTRCRDISVEAIDDHIAMIKKQNDHIAKLDAKIAEHELENEKFKFARSMLYNGRALALRMSLVSNREAMSSLMPLKDYLILLRAKLPWFRIVRVTFYILQTILNIRLGEFMLENLTLFPITYLCIKMRLLALGNQLM
jgi:chromosome segregation ATPase